LQAASRLPQRYLQTCYLPLATAIFIGIGAGKRAVSLLSQFAGVADVPLVAGRLASSAYP